LREEFQSFDKKRLHVSMLTSGAVVCLCSAQMAAAAVEALCGEAQVWFH